MSDAETVIFDFPPDWSGGVSETLAHQTDILQSRDGTEQRRSLRTKPRAGMEYTVSVRGDDINRLDGALWAGQASAVKVPFWPGKVSLSSAASSGDHTVRVAAIAPPKVVSFEDDKIPDDMTVVSGAWTVRNFSYPTPPDGTRYLEGYPFYRQKAILQMPIAGPAGPLVLAFWYYVNAYSPAADYRFRLRVNGEVRFEDGKTTENTGRWLSAALSVVSGDVVSFEIEWLTGGEYLYLDAIKVAPKGQYIPLDVKPGDSVLIRDRTRSAAYVVDQVSGDELTLASPLGESWPAGSELYPCWDAFMQDTIQSTRRTSAVAEMRVAFAQKVSPDKAPAPNYGPDMKISGGQAGVIEALIRPVNWASGMSLDYEFAKTVLDTQTGPIAYEAPLRFPRRTFKGTVLAKNRHDVGWWKAFFNRVKGRRQQFLIPTWQKDLPLRPPSSPGHWFEVPGVEMAERMASSSQVYTHIFVKRKDGVRAFYRLYGMSADTVNNVTQIFTENWNESYTPDEAPFACLACCVRMASDTMTVNWLTDGVATIELAVTSVDVHYTES